MPPIDDCDDNDDGEILPETVPVIKPNIEIKLDSEKRRECRDIVTEIRNFGVNQRQILFLIQLLALELENREVMQRIVGVVGESREEIPPVGSSIIIPRDSGNGIE